MSHGTWIELPHAERHILREMFAMISYCLDSDIEPCWDAANTWSVGLAEKLGFVNTRPYTAYWIPPGE